jgi:DNA-binding transcriptional MerR regulator
MSETIHYGLCELARELDLPESTARYYRDVFAPFIPTVGVGRRRRYPEEALEKLKFIAGAFAEGRTREEIARALASSGAPQLARSEAENLGANITHSQAKSDQLITSLLDGEREQRELMWQMIRELSRFGDAIERQHYILSELVDRVFQPNERRLPAADNGDTVENVIDADIISETVEEATSVSGRETSSSRDDVESLRKALETERDLVDRLRQSKLDLERRAAAAEAELEHTQEHEPSLLRRFFDRNRGL